MSLSRISAFLYPLRGLRLIWRTGFRRYAALPFAINVTLFSAMGALYFSHAGSWIDRMLPPGGWQEHVRWLAWPVLAAAFLLASLFTFTAVGNLLAAPFSDRLTERVLASLDPQFAPRAGISWATAGRSVVDAGRSLWHLVTGSMPVLILFLIPGLNILAPLAWFAVGSWLLALGYLEYPASAQGVSFTELRRTIRRQPLVTLAFGTGVAMLTMTPILNLAAIPASVAGATLLWQERLRRPR